MTSAEQPDAYSQSLARIRTRLVEGLPGKIGEIRSQVVGSGADDTQEARPRKLHRLFHDMAGNSAMLGYHDFEAIVRQGLVTAERADNENRNVSAAEAQDLIKILMEIERHANVLATEMMQK
jgi:HPt (histidine-containing phosphotransfer) domain-containing protein